MSGIGPDWRLIDGVVTAWFDAPSLIEGAALAGRIGTPAAEVDLRTSGVRVRLDSPTYAEEVSVAARDLGLTANPAVLQVLSVVIESANPAEVSRFWQRVLGDPAIRIRPSTEPRPLRNRVHVDVVRPAAVVEQVRPGEPSGPWNARHSDPDGNEVDLVPGGRRPRPGCRLHRPGGRTPDRRPRPRGDRRPGAAALRSGLPRRR